MAEEGIAAVLLLAPPAGLAVNVGVHLLVCRVMPGLSHLFAIMAGFAAGAALTGIAGVTTLAAANLTRADLCGYSLLMLCTYGALGYGYFTLVNLAATSLRIRILRIIFEMPERRIGDGELKNFYSADDLLNIRFERLVKWGQITRSEGAIAICGTPALLLLHRLILVRRKLLLPRH